MTDLVDISTSSGAFTQFFFRWKNLIWCTFVGFTILLGISFMVYKYAGQSEEPPESTFLLSGSKLMYYGNKSKFEDRYFDPFPGLPNVTESKSVDTIEIKWVRIDGQNLSSALSKYYPHIKTLHLNNVTLGSYLEPIRMEALEEFYLNQGLEPEETSSPDYSLDKIGASPTWLQSTLFFLNDNSSDFGTKATNVYKNGINVTIFLKGSIAYQMNPKSGEVRLDISECSTTLDKLPKNYTTVTLGRCTDLRADSLPSTVKVLNFYIVYISTQLLSGMLRQLKNLEEFSAEIPDGNVQIDLMDFSNKIRLISISSMNIRPINNGSLPSVEDFYFGAENQYSWLPSRLTMLNNTLYENFAKIFPNVERVGLFELKDENRYKFLNNVLSIKSIKWVLAVNFLRLNNTNISKELPQPVQLVVEDELTHLGLDKNVGDFIIEIQPDGIRTARVVTKMEKLWFRYKYLCWSPIDSWPKYLYVRKLIESGELL